MFFSELVLRSVRKMTYANWSLNGQVLYDIGPPRSMRFLLQTRTLLWEYFRAQILMKFEYNQGSKLTNSER